MKMPSSKECVKVIVRIRPFIEREKKLNCVVVAEADYNLNQIYIRNPKAKEDPKTFAFDLVYGPEIGQRRIYNEVGFPLVESVLQGFNGTIFAYGQTGCGKTYTMVGDKDDEEKKGITPNSLTQIFTAIDADKGGIKYLVRCSYIEIYNEDIFDLLSNDVEAKLQLKENSQSGVYIKDLNCLIVNKFKEIDNLLTQGFTNRHKAETSMNKESSRSHCIFTIYIESAESRQDGSERIIAGKLNLVDLAGSERQSKTNATGLRLKEGCKINLSLSALSNVISALVDGKSSHIPYRDSKLTRLLQDSLGGNAKTVMIANISPADNNYDESLGTLRYAYRAKNIQNIPKVNEDPKDALIKQYEIEIQRLKAMLEGKLPITIDKNATKTEIPNNSHNQIINSPQIIYKTQTQNIGPSEDFEELKREKDLLNQDKKRFVDELMNKENEINREKSEKNNMLERIRELEKRVIFGGQIIEIKDKNKNQELRHIQLKIEEQKKNEALLIKEKQRKEDELLLVEKKYNDLKDEVQDYRNILKKLRAKYQVAATEIRDIQIEQQRDKEELLSNIREQDKELDFYKGIVEKLANESEIEKIRAKSVWKGDAWELPLFTLTNRTINLPTISEYRKIEIDNDRENKEITIFSNTKTNVRPFKATKLNKMSLAEKKYKESPIAQARKELIEIEDDYENEEEFQVEKKLNRFTLNPIAYSSMPHLGWGNSNNNQYVELNAQTHSDKKDNLYDSKKLKNGIMRKDDDKIKISNFKKAKEVSKNEIQFIIKGKLKYK